MLEPLKPEFGRLAPRGSRSVLLSLLLLLLWASVPGFASTGVNTSVDLGYSIYVGTELEDNGTGVTQWLGMRYAAAPLGELRFSPPQDPVYNATVQQANAHGSGCLGVNTTDDSTTSEDCLFIDVFAPSVSSISVTNSSGTCDGPFSSSTSSSSLLPVFFYINGGGFAFNSNTNINGTSLVQASNYSIIVVTFNYRVGPFGFLTRATSTLSSSSSYCPITPNNGLQDQRKALEWVQRHIARFGGDPAHVVLGGNSAGAGSIALHLVAYGGRDEGLFHAAAAGSVSFAPVLSVAQSEYQFGNLSAAVGCDTAGTSDGSGSNNDDAAVVECLRCISAAELNAHSAAVPYPSYQSSSSSYPDASPPLYMWGPTLDGEMLSDYTYRLFEQGRFIRVPLLAGDDANGGTVFAPMTAATLTDSNAFMREQFPQLTDAQLDCANALYLNPDNASCPASGCYWRQASNTYGEARYMCPGLYVSATFAGAVNDSAGTGSAAETKSETERGRKRERRKGRSTWEKRLEGDGQRRDGLMVDKRSSGSSAKNGTVVSVRPTAPSYAYLWNVQDPTQEAEGYGVPHTVEVNAIFGPGYFGTAPTSYYNNGENWPAVAVAQAYWTSFIRTYDPNTYRLAGSAEWKGYADEGLAWQRMRFDTGGATAMETVEAGLQERCQFWWDNGISMQQ